MPQIDVKPLFLKNVTLQLGLDNYEKHVSGVTFVPTTAQATWSGLTPDASFTRSTPSTWVANLDYVQDWETADSLSRYLLANEGATIPATFVPEDGSSTFAADVTIVPGQIGGAGGAFATSSVSLGSTRPVETPVVAGA